MNPPGKSAFTLMPIPIHRDPARRVQLVSLALALLAWIAPAGAADKAIEAGSEVLVAAPVPKDEELEAAGAIIGDIVLEKRNIFDLSDPKEDKWLYRWANRLHVVTRDHVIRNQVLFEGGDAFSGRMLEETERIVRSNRFIYDARVEPVRYEDGVVDVKVTTQDVWSLTPDFSFSRSGGENRTALGIEETNLLGRGQLLRLKWIDNVDRTSTQFDFEDTNLGSSWVSMFLRVADNSDGETQFLSIVRPFYSLDARGSGGGWVSIDEAAEYRHQRDYITGFAGWSAGLRDGWARRWTAGYVYDDNVFSEAVDPTLPAVIPEDRKLVYPYLAVEVLQDDFSTTSNTNQIGRTEDFYMGTRFTASVGYADESFGADRDALIVSATVNMSFGSLDKTALLLAGSTQGRREGGNSKNAETSIRARFYHRQSEKRLFFMELSGTAGHDLDLDNPVQLGGKSGLRGYPLRYQTGDSKALFSIEQRYFTDWYPWRLFRVGGAIFADVGRTWGDNPIDEQNYGWLRDVGFGFRFAPTRFSTNKVAHLDFAFPLDGDPSIDSVQILLEAKRSF
jgi:outer membrane protein assembly factor BamA